MGIAGWAFWRGRWGRVARRDAMLSWTITGLGQDPHPALRPSREARRFWGTGSLL